MRIRIRYIIRIQDKSGSKRPPVMRIHFWTLQLNVKRKDSFQKLFFCKFLNPHKAENKHAIAVSKNKIATAGPPSAAALPSVEKIPAPTTAAIPKHVKSRRLRLLWSDCPFDSRSSDSSFSRLMLFFCRTRSQMVPLPIR